MVDDLRKNGQATHSGRSPPRHPQVDGGDDTTSDNAPEDGPPRGQNLREHDAPPGRDPDVHGHPDKSQVPPPTPVGQEKPAGGNRGGKGIAATNDGPQRGGHPADHTTGNPSPNPTPPHRPSVPDNTPQGSPGREAPAPATA
ncbi:hypothetical protein [Actinophytocola oryzae]|uniref:hypothetical protein n=1 Tax=Actinophytocola oryzae TaxID=502181 RepID=UPI00141501B2|nr:hypothetical protein [Actinophytocola oryzae]